MEQWRATPLPGLKAERLFFQPQFKTAFLKDMPEPCCQGAAGAGLFPDEPRERDPHGSSAWAQLLQIWQVCEVATRFNFGQSPAIISALWSNDYFSDALGKSDSSESDQQGSEVMCQLEAVSFSLCLDELKSAPPWCSHRCLKCPAWEMCKISFQERSLGQAEVKASECSCQSSYWRN